MHKIDDKEHCRLWHIPVVSQFASSILQIKTFQARICFAVIIILLKFPNKFLKFPLKCSQQDMLMQTTIAWRRRQVLGKTHHFPLFNVPHALEKEKLVFPTLWKLSAQRWKLNGKVEISFKPSLPFQAALDVSKHGKSSTSRWIFAMNVHDKVFLLHQPRAHMEI